MLLLLASLFRNKKANMSRIFIKILLFLSLLLPINSWAAQSDFLSQNKNAKVRLIASYKKEDNKNKKLILGFHFKLKNDWKIYGKSDSSFVQEPIFDFSKSDNINTQNFKILWPKAKIITENILDETISYPVYGGEVVIPVEIEVLDNQKIINLDVNLMYALCNDICIPVNEDFKLNVDAGEIDEEVLKLANQSQKDKITKPTAKITLLSAIIFSFIGGLILNIMPCVLPVLSLKLVSIVKHTKSSLKRIRFAFASTILGILFCFLLFAVIISSLKMLGSNIGWGSQFQSPYFLIFLIIVLTIFTANLLGLFEIHVGSLLSNVLSKKISDHEKKGDILHVFISNFLSGILAVLLATPCSAPFLGTAISFAFLQDSLIIFTIFTFMAIGLAFPYFVLIIFPKAVKLLPKPGNWMKKINNLMAGFLVATIVWIAFILMHNIGFIAAILVVFCSTLLLLCFRLCNKFQISKFKEIIIIAIVSILIMILPIKVSKYYMAQERTYNGLWMKFDEGKIQNYVDDGKTVVVDVTADWCITCKLNKKLVLESKEIVEILKKPNIIAMRGDLTKPDETIFVFMESHGRYAIPFNIVYGPNARNGILLSELLSKKEFLKAIQKAK